MKYTFECFMIKFNPGFDLQRPHGGCNCIPRGSDILLWASRVLQACGRLTRNHTKHLYTQKDN